MAGEAKFKHLDYLQAAIGRMANNSFLFKGWSITIAAALSGFAAVNTQSALLVIALATTVLFWGLDGYYLWLERGFIKLYNRVAALEPEQIDFKMVIDKNRAVRCWLATCSRPHLIAFYGVIVAVDVIGIFVIKGGS